MLMFKIKFFSAVVVGSTMLALAATVANRLINDKPMITLGWFDVCLFVAAAVVPFLAFVED